MTYLDLQLRLPELLLMRVDKMTMATAVEARLPFLDHRLVEQVLTLPMRAKIPQGRLKHLLKLAVKDLLPAQILDRPKQGFAVPIDEWLLSGLGPAVQSTIDAFAKEQPYLHPEYMRRFTTPLTGARQWYLLNLALWHRQWIEQRPLPDALAALGQDGRLSA
jgi:asparagine synthase (glutamine-hydrolysing)